MKKIENIGNMPRFLKPFLTNRLFTESEDTEVYDCTYDEIIDKAQKDKLEPQVLIDREHRNAYLCAVGASYESSEITGMVKTPPVFYFAKLEEHRRREFMNSLTNARIEYQAKRKAEQEASKKIKEETREAGKKIDPTSISSRYGEKGSDR